MRVDGSVSAELDEIRLEKNSLAGDGDFVFDQNATDQAGEIYRIRGGADDRDARFRGLTHARTAQRGGETPEEEITPVQGGDGIVRRQETCWSCWFEPKRASGEPTSRVVRHGKRGTGVGTFRP